MSLELDSNPEVHLFIVKTKIKQTVSASLLSHYHEIKLLYAC